MTIFIRGAREGGIGTREETGRDWRERWNWQAFYEWAPVIGGDVHADFNVDKIYIWWEASGEYSAHLRNISARSWSNPSDREDVRLNDSFVGLVRSLFLYLLYDPQARRAVKFPCPTFMSRVESLSGTVRRDNVISHYLRNSSSRFNLHETRQNRGERMACLVEKNYTETDDAFRLNSG